MNKIGLLALVFVILATGCNKKKTGETTDPNYVDFSVAVQDTLLFDNLKELTLPVSVQRISGASTGDCKLTFETIDNPNFSVSANDLSCPINDSRSFTVRYNVSLVPGIYRATITVTQFNVNNPKVVTKTVYLKVSPDCEYDYRNSKNGIITYISNGNPTNKSITCSYYSDNTLEVKNLANNRTLYLNLDCATSQVSMAPYTSGSFLYTGNGTVVGNQINFNLYSDGALFATMDIMP